MHAGTSEKSLLDVFALHEMGRYALADAAAALKIGTARRGGVEGIVDYSLIGYEHWHTLTARRAGAP